MSPYHSHPIIIVQVCLIFLIIILFYDGSIVGGPRGRAGGLGGPGRPARGAGPVFF